MSKTITLRLPPACAQKMGLNPAPEGIYTFSWIELAFRLTQATGNQGFADVDKVRRGFTSHWYALAATRMALERPDWRQLAWQTGLLALYDDKEEIDRETAVCFLECFFQAIFAQPARFQDCEARSVRPEHVMGWVNTLSIEELSALAGGDDARQTETESWRPSLMASALDLYLRQSGQIPTSETDEVLKPEPLVIPIPDPAAG